MKYKKKTIVDAEQFIPTGEMFMEYPVQRDEKGTYITIETLEGNLRCNWGDYVITGARGERYPCRKDIFEETYELCA